MSFFLKVNTYMKSIVQEGSTICKAVESAWQAAGKPQEFTVKVLEEPQHNFIGMTVRSAKVALFFKDGSKPEKPSRKEVEKERPTRGKKQRGSRGEFSGQKPYGKESRIARVNFNEELEFDHEEREPKPHRKAYEAKEQHAQEAHEETSFDGVFWTPEMITMAKDWLQGSLAAMDKSNIHYSTGVNRLYFKVAFDEPVNQNPQTERQIFRSFAMLLMQHMRNKLKRPLKGFKVVLSRGGHEETED